MTLQAFAAPSLEDMGSVFDISRNWALAPANQDAPFSADRPDPQSGWATRNPDKAMLFLFVTPRDGRVVDELLAL